MRPLTRNRRERRINGKEREERRGNEKQKRETQKDVTGSTTELPEMYSEDKGKHL
jgi:hypothetical protein